MATVGASSSKGTTSLRNDPGMELVSSCRVEKISSIFASFDSQKKELLCSIGFGGLLNLRSFENLNPHLNLWLLRRYDSNKRCLHLDRGVDLEFKAPDVNLVLSIPCSGQPVNFISLPTINTITSFKKKMFIETTSSRLSLSFLEHILTKEYGSHMNPQERNAFIISVVLYASTYLLAPEIQHDFPIYLIQNFLPDVKPEKLNWADFVLSTLDRASVHATLQFNTGCKRIELFGCCLFLQVFYLDNLKFGPSTPFHGLLPRASAFLPDSVSKMISSDCIGISYHNLMQYGKTEVRPAHEVCYSRGWKLHMPLAQNTSEHSFEPAFRAAIYGRPVYTRSIQCSTSQDMISNKVPLQIASSSNSQIPTFQPIKMISHSKFPMSPFDLGFSHPKVECTKKYMAYKWMTEASLSKDELLRDWIIFEAPTPLFIPGHIIKHCLKLDGSFTITLVDAIMVLWNYLDAAMYAYYQKIGHTHKQWRHFLPASFAETVIDGNDYLNSELIKACFIGDHITYHIGDCQMIIMPVLQKGSTWACYFWDVKEKRINVLDPLLMDDNPAEAKKNHRDTVLKLHRALIRCIDHFFDGWNIHSGRWTDIYFTDVASKSKEEDSGLEAVHYARSFSGKDISYIHGSDEASLTEARGEILFLMVSCADNKASKPRDLMESLNS